MSGQKVAIVEDTPEILTLLSDALDKAGYAIQGFSNAAAFENREPASEPDLCIVDLGLPDKDGLALVSQLAANSQTSILVISGRSALSDKILGLELGADDYISKPFDISEVVARVNALMRRRAPIESPALAAVEHFCGWTADFSSFMLIDEAGQQKRMSSSEADLLKVFLKNAGKLLTREQLQVELDDKSDSTSFDRAVDVRISRLRSKLGDSTRNPKIIKTIYGAGYIFLNADAE